MPRFTKTCHVSPTSWRRVTRAKVSSRSSVSALVAGEWCFCENLFRSSNGFDIQCSVQVLCQRLHNFKLSAFVSFLPPHDMSYAISSCVCAFFSIQDLANSPVFEMAPAKLRRLLIRNIWAPTLWWPQPSHLHVTSKQGWIKSRLLARTLAA